MIALVDFDLFLLDTSYIELNRSMSTYDEDVIVVSVESEATFNIIVYSFSGYGSFNLIVTVYTPTPFIGFIPRVTIVIALLFFLGLSTINFIRKKGK